MSDYAVTGKKGSGKGLFCVGVMKEALLQGRRVVTNMDIYPEKLVGPYKKTDIIRIPDMPTVRDLELIGKGYEGKKIDEDRNGLIVLDETSKFFNARSWGDKERQPLLDWLIHARKLRWDVYYQMQGLSQIDKQVRETQVEYHIPVKNTSKWPIPVLGTITGIFGYKLHFPKSHLGIVKHGCDVHALVIGRKWYRATGLYEAYDTEQVFLDRDHPDAVGPYSLLSPWLTHGRYLPPPPNPLKRFVYNLIGKSWVPEPLPVRASLPKHHLVELLRKLPESQAIYHWNRLNSLGAFDGFACETRARR